MPEKIPSYKVWHCSYRWSGGYGAYQEHECVVVAEIKDKALGMALTAYDDTDPTGWSASEIEMDKEGVHHISSHGS